MAKSMSSESLPLTVIVVTYNHQKYIAECIKSILSAGANEIIIIDNASTDNTISIVESFLNNHALRLVQNKVNLGYGSAVNIGVRLANNETIIIQNPDTIVNPNCYQLLHRSLLSGDKIISSPIIMMYDGTIVNTLGNIEHFTGLGLINGIGLPAHTDFSKYSINGISGACFAIFRKNYLEIGGFDENFFCYMEDVELSWRALSLDYQFILVPGAFINHDYQIKLTSEKFFQLEKGRYYILKKFLTRREIISILPSLIIVEILSFTLALINGNDFIKKKVEILFKINSIKPVPFKWNARLLSSLDTNVPDIFTLNKSHKNLFKLINLLFLINKMVIKK